MDFNVLKNNIIDIPIKLCKKASREKYRNTWLPKSYYDDLKFLCEQYDVRLFFHNKSYNEYDVYYVNNKEKRRIFLSSLFHKCESFKKRMCFGFCHELAHHIQAITRRLTGDNSYGYQDFETGLKFERTAERLAYFVYKKYFSHVYKIKHHDFDDYKDKKSVEFYKKWFIRNCSYLKIGNKDVGSFKY